MNGNDETRDQANTDPRDPRRLDEIVAALRGVRAELAAVRAREAEVLASAVDLVAERAAASADDRRAFGHNLPLREVTTEIGAALRLSDRTVQGRMGDAAVLVARYAATHDALRTGQIDPEHVSAILDGGAIIADDEVRARYEQRILEIAREESPNRLRPIARVLAARLDPQSAEEQHTRARQDRRVRVYDTENGMGRLLMDAPVTLVRGVFDRITQMAKSLDNGDGDVRTADTADERTLDEKRADVLCDLALAGAPAGHGDADGLGAIRATVHVTIPVLTLAGVGDEPALLAGHGPIDADTARRLAAGAPGWDRIMTHPGTGIPLGVDRYRPSAELKRYLHARDEHCRFPGCVRAARESDMDHTIDAALGGETSAKNLGLFCESHHIVKHNTPWQVRQVGGGVFEWTSPNGRVYTDRPVPVVQFVPDAMAPFHAAVHSPGRVSGGDPPRGVAGEDPPPW